MVIFSEGLCRVVEQFLKKGSKVYLEGQLQTRKWQGQDGQDRYSTEVVLQNFNGTLVLLDRPSGGAGTGTGSGMQEEDFSYNAGGSGSLWVARRRQRQLQAQPPARGRRRLRQEGRRRDSVLIALGGRSRSSASALLDW